MARQKNIFSVDGPTAVEVYDNFMDAAGYTAHTKRTKRTAFTQFVRWATGDKIERRKRGTVTSSAKGKRKAQAGRPSVGDEDFTAKVTSIMKQTGVSRSTATKLAKTNLIAA